MRVPFVSLALTIVLGGTVDTQVHEPSGESQWARDVGGEIRVTGTDGSVATGQFRAIDADALRLLVAGQKIDVSRDAIARIERRGDSVWNGFIIGALAGILPTVLVSGEIEAGGGNRAVAVIAGIGLYGLVGAGIDAMHEGWTTVYAAAPAERSARRKRQLSVAPHAHGMRVTYTRRF